MRHVVVVEICMFHNRAMKKIPVVSGIGDYTTQLCGDYNKPL